MAAPTGEGGIFAGLPAIADPYAQWVVQIAVILCMTRLLALIMSPLRQPPVIAEMIGGILLGPSALSRIPAFANTIFPASALPGLTLFGNVALSLFLFVIGMELDFTVIARSWRKSIAISLSGIVIPFGLGAAVAVVLFNNYATPTATYKSTVRRRDEITLQQMSSALYFYAAFFQLGWNGLPIRWSVCSIVVVRLFHNAGAVHRHRGGHYGLPRAGTHPLLRPPSLHARGHHRDERRGGEW